MRRSSVLMVRLVCGAVLVAALYVLVQGLDALPSFRSSPDQLPGAPVTEHTWYWWTLTGKPICPKCGRFDNVREFLYGLPRGAPPEGRIGGGCVVGPDSPRYKCGNCEATFGITSQGR